jgi:hypothetical protein
MRAGWCAASAPPPPSKARCKGVAGTPLAAPKCACTCATNHNSAHTPRLSSDACWLRWRRLPMACPGVEGCTQGAMPGSPRKYCSKPIIPASNAASNKPAASCDARNARPSDACPPGSERRNPRARQTANSASTAPQVQAATSGQKLDEGGCEYANRNGKATANRVSGATMAFKSMSIQPGPRGKHRIIGGAQQGRASGLVHAP